MIVRYLVLLFFFYSVSSCGGKLEVAEKPENLLTEKQMEEVLRDLMILEGHIHENYESVNRYYKIMTGSGKALLKQKNITEEQYESSFVYYNANPEIMERILDNVLDSFQKESLLLQQELKDTLQVLKGLMINDSLKLSPPSIP